jgi:signal transduction histidine kinase
MFDILGLRLLVLVEYITFLTAGWYIYIKGRKCLDNTWLFIFILLVGVIPTAASSTYFPFKTLLFFTLVLALNTASSLYIYSFPRSRPINKPWLITIATVNTLLVYMFSIFSEHTYFVYFVEATLFTTINTAFIARKLKYLKPHRRKSVGSITSIPLLIAAVMTLSSAVSLLLYNINFARYAVVAVTPVLLILFLILLIKKINTDTGLSYFLLLTFLFFSIPTGLMLIPFSKFRVLMVSLFGINNFFIPATLSSFAVINSVAFIILFISILTNNYFNVNRVNIRRRISNHRKDVEKIADYRLLFNHFNSTVKRHFKDISDISYILFIPDKRTESLQSNIPLKPELATSDLVKWFSREEKPFLLKRSVNIPPDFAKVMEELNADLVIPMRSPKEIFGLIGFQGRFIKASTAEALYEFVTASLDRFEKISLFDKILNAEKKIQESKHFQETGKMVSFIAHELRTPLSSIMFNMDVLINDVKKGSPVDIEYLEISKREVKRLNDIVEKMLTYGRDIKLSTEKGTFKQFYTDIRYLFSSARIELIIDNQLKDKSYIIDWDHLKHVVVNLVNNSVQALEKAEEEGFVKINTFEAGNQIFIEVSDNGPGIADEKSDSIFEPFFTTKKGGNGLGLAICKKIVKLSGGSVELTSTSSRGTLFTVKIPVDIPEETKV